VASEADPVTGYARDVVAGRVVAGQLVRLACERHLDDLEHGFERGLRFDTARAQRAIAFFGYLRHSKGEWAGRVFALEPWQQFIVGSLFGWIRDDDTRRFRRAYVSVARKNGKTQLAAAIGLLLAFFDGEPGAEVYAAATHRDQAKICWSEAKRMVESSPDLKRRVNASVGALFIESLAAKFAPVSRDFNHLDGFNPSGAIIDEYHAHPTGELADVIESGTGARRQPLMIYTTTAGWNTGSACHDLDLDVQRILERQFADDSVFGFVARLDPEDSWDDETVWAKANPNLGVSVKLDALREACEKAKRMPREVNEFRRKRCNQWTEQAERWIDLDAWDACDAAPAPVPGQRCFLGLDLSSTTDITAAVAVFPPRDKDGFWDVQCAFWMPEENLTEKMRADRAPYDVWAREGYLRLTEGNVVDYDVLRDDIKHTGAFYQIHELPYDPWNATQLATQLGQDGARVVPLGQGYSNLSEPTKFLESLILTGKLRHGGHPVLRWMAANVAVQHGPNDSIRPVKGKSTGRIDGVVALVMGIARAMVADEHAGESVYERRGLTTLTY